jgi:acyl-coenzyme A synthetase/AMP-(fatty) acid ligase
MIIKKHELIRIIERRSKEIENTRQKAPGKSLEAIYKGTMIHEIGHNLGGNHKDTGHIMDYTFAREKRPANCLGDCGEGVYTYSMSYVDKDGIRAIMGRMGQTIEVDGRDGPRISTYSVIRSAYLTSKENDRITEGSVGKLTLIQNQ